MATCTCMYLHVLALLSSADPLPPSICSVANPNRPHSHRLTIIHPISTFFEHKGVPVLGSIFNKLATEGFYSREVCSIILST